MHGMRLIEIHTLFVDRLLNRDIPVVKVSVKYFLLNAPWAARQVTK